MGILYVIIKYTCYWFYSIKKIKPCGFALVYANLWKPRLQRSAKCLLELLKTLWIKMNQQIASAPQLDFMKIPQLKYEVINLPPASQGSGIKIIDELMPIAAKKSCIFYL